MIIAQIIAISLHSDALKPIPSGVGDALLVGVGEGVGEAVGAGDGVDEIVGAGEGVGLGVGLGDGEGEAVGTVPTFVIVTFTTPASPGPWKSMLSGPTIKSRVDALCGSAVPFACW
jgi:hypothetical protein